MQSPALIVALVLLGIGVLLNSAVLAYFAIRILRSGLRRRRTGRITTQPALAVATR